ncbi:MAG: glycosyltransferase family 2 protein [Geminicoccaceae bacterium]
MSDAQVRPLVSLITVVLNGGDAFRRTFESVFAQRYQPIEYIVIDGESTDGSVDLIKRHSDRIAYWVSEPDQGISDAFNKGIAAAKGDYIGLLNADDWLSPEQVEEAVRTLEASDAGFAFGDLLYHAPDGTPLHMIKGDPDYETKIKSLMPALNHPTMLVRRSVFDDIGGFDQRYKVAMDYDWALRAHLAGYKGEYSKNIVGHMTLDGTSDRQFVRSLIEVRRIATSHGQNPLTAWPLFCSRVVKGMAQRLLHRFAPTSFYHALRGLINRDYQSVRS